METLDDAHHDNEFNILPDDILDGTIFMLHIYVYAYIITFWCEKIESQRVMLFFQNKMLTYINNNSYKS